MKVKKNKKGFTLVELLATIIILGLLIGITVYIAINVIGKSKEKSYQVTINEIEKNSGNYISERNELVFKPTGDEDYEYQCVTVENLIDYGYLSNDVLDSKVNETDTVSPGDYIYVERNKTTKAITKSLYTKNYPEYLDKCGEVMIGNGMITFTSNPDFYEWSKSKDITIIYNVTSLNDVRTIDKYSFNHEYKGTYTYDEANDTLNRTTKTKVVTVTSNGTLKADITLEGNPIGEPASVNIDHIDTLGPVITNHYNGINTVRHSVTIPLKVVDRNVSGYEVSGVNYSSFTKDDIEVKVGSQVITDYKLEHKSKENYNLIINNDMYNGTITLNIPKDKVFDIAGNGNDDTPIDTGITFDNTYKITYHGNGGTSSKWGDTWEGTVKYGEEYSTPENWYTRKGYNFNGWNEAANGSATVWGLNSNGVFEAIRDNGKSKWQWTYTNDIDLYAQWTAKTYTINYNCGTGSGTAPASQTVKYDEEVTIPNNAGSCSQTGHILSNLTSPGKNGSGSSNWKGWTGKWQYDNGEYGISNNTLTLTATWTAKSITVTFSCNGGTGGGNRTYTYGVTGQTFPNPALCTYTGKSGSNWSRPDGTTHTWTSGISDSWINNVYDNKYENSNHNITLTANWRANKVYIRFNMNSGSLNSNHGTSISSNGNWILIGGNQYYGWNYNSTINLPNWNNKDYINITRSGYHAKSGSEWCTGTSANGTCYNHATDYGAAGTDGTASTHFCDARSADCYVTLYVAWEEDCDYCCQCYCCCYSCPPAADPPPADDDGGGVCFVKGTKVLTPSGMKNIEELKKGDTVYSYNEENNTVEVDKVSSNHKRVSTEDIYTIYIENTSISVTPTHPFYVKGKGWTKVKDLKENDILINNLGFEIPIKKIKISGNSLGTNVYNLTVSKNHTYFAGLESVLVHNKVCFLAGTKVMTMMGYKDIEKIKFGDMVLTYNEEKGINEYQPVTMRWVLNNEHNELYLHTLTFDDNSNIKSTANHKYYVLRNNKKLWLQAKDIVFGDYVKYANGEYHQVVNNTYEIINDTVYTLSVANTHNYYVGENQVLVHNVTQIRHEAWAS